MRPSPTRRLAIMKPQRAGGGSDEQSIVPTSGIQAEQQEDANRHAANSAAKPSGWRSEHLERPVAPRPGPGAAGTSCSFMALAGVAARSDCGARARSRRWTRTRSKWSGRARSARRRRAAGAGPTRARVQKRSAAARISAGIRRSSAVLERAHARRRRRRRRSARSSIEAARSRGRCTSRSGRPRCRTAGMSTPAK